MNDRVLVTGGGGFIGSAVAEGLLGKGKEVTVLDVREPPFETDWIRADLLDGSDLRHELSRFDYICHLAAIADVYQALRDPVLTARMNVEAAERLLVQGAEAGIKRFVYASTWEVYGRPLYEPMDEKHPCNPDHPYSITKLAGERLCLSSSLPLGVSVISLRLGTAYGPRMRPNAVISKFVENGLLKKPISIHGSGEQSRQFTHVLDIARAFNQALDYRGHEQVFNITSKERISISNLANKLGLRFGVPVEHVPSRLGDPPSGRVSSELAFRELGWKPEIEFGNGLDDFLSRVIPSERIGRDESSARSIREAPTK